MSCESKLRRGRLTEIRKSLAVVFAVVGLTTCVVSQGTQRPRGARDESEIKEIVAKYARLLTPHWHPRSGSILPMSHSYTRLVMSTALTKSRRTCTSV